MLFYKMVHTPIDTVECTCIVQRPVISENNKGCISLDLPQGGGISYFTRENKYEALYKCHRFAFTDQMLHLLINDLFEVDVVQFVMLTQFLCLAALSYCWRTQETDSDGLMGKSKSMINILTIFGLNMSI